MNYNRISTTVRPLVYIIMWSKKLVPFLYQNYANEEYQI